MQATLAAWPTQKAATKESFIGGLTKQVDKVLVMFYALLAMSVVISVFGIVNTLVLSVHERTREIGMLRAIGATRRQLRQMVRYESVITSVIGGVLGTLVGIVFGYVSSRSSAVTASRSACRGCSSASSWCWPSWSASSPRCCPRAAPAARTSWRRSSTSDPDPRPLSPWGGLLRHGPGATETSRPARAPLAPRTTSAMVAWRP